MGRAAIAMPCSDRRRDPELRRSALAAVLFAGVLVLAALLRADPAGATLAGIAGPECLLGGAIGAAACPGCGLTRSTALVVHGDLLAALHIHAGGLVVVLACLAGLLVHGHILVSGRRSSRHDLLLRAGRILFAGGLLAAWAARLLLEA